MGKSSCWYHYDLLARIVRSAKLTQDETGASMGIGKAIAHKLADAGSHLVLVSRSQVMFSLDRVGPLGTLGSLNRRPREF